MDGNGKIGKFKYAPIIGIDILSGILIKTAGKSVLKFAQDNLFSPLEISVDKNIYFQSKQLRKEWERLEHEEQEADTF